MNEHRKSTRLRSYKGASVLFEAALSVECIIRNISKTGACREFPTHVIIPDQFTLLIKADTFMRKCRVAPGVVQTGSVSSSRRRIRVSVRIRSSLMRFFR